MDVLAKFLTAFFLTTAMLGVGLQVGSADIRSTLAARSLLARSLVVNFALVPALGILIVRLVPMPSDTAAGFLLLALAPGGMSALQFTSRAKGALLYAGALSFILSLLSVFVSPAIAGLLLPTKSSVPFPRLIAILLCSFFSRSSSAWAFDKSLRSSRRSWRSRPS